MPGVLLSPVLQEPWLLFCKLMACGLLLRPAMCCTGGVWRHAEEAFCQMGAYHCVPDAVTFTALISAYEKGAQEPRVASMWQLALRAYEHVRLQPDLIPWQMRVC